MNKPYILPALCAIVATAPFASAAGQETAPENVLSVAEAAAYLREIGLPTDRAAAERAALEALVRAADPGGRILTEEASRSYMPQREDGFMHFGFFVTNATRFPVVGHVLHSEHLDETFHRGVSVLSMNGQSLENTAAPACNQFLLTATNGTLSVVYRNGDEIRTQDVRRVTAPPPEISDMIMLKEEFLYCRVFGFTAAAAEDFTVRLTSELKANRAHGLILDLRDSDGRRLSAVAEALDIFAPEKALLFKYRDFNDRETLLYEGQTPAVITGVPVMLLVNARTREAAEVFAAALKGLYPKSLIIGESTAADPMIRSLHRLASGDVLYLRTRQLVCADGPSYDGEEGVAPDIRIPASCTPIFDRRHLTEKRSLESARNSDICLTRALDILSGIRALEKNNP